VKIEDPYELVGRTFERDGMRREVTRVERSIGYDIYWRRPGGNERKEPMWWPNFQTWVENADEVTVSDERDDEDICGHSFDHDLIIVDERDGILVYHCRRCGAEIHEDEVTT